MWSNSVLCAVIIQMECETELIKTEESAHYELLRESQTQECWGDFRGKYVSVNRIWSGLMGKLFGFLGIFFSGGLIRELSGVDQKNWSSRQVLNVPAVPIKINSNFFHCFLNFLNFKLFFEVFEIFHLNFFLFSFCPSFLDIFQPFSFPPTPTFHHRWPFLPICICIYYFPSLNLRAI